MHKGLATESTQTKVWGRWAQRTLNNLQEGRTRAAACFLQGCWNQVPTNGVGDSPKAQPLYKRLLSTYYVSGTVHTQRFTVSKLPEELVLGLSSEVQAELAGSPGLCSTIRMSFFVVCFRFQVGVLCRWKSIIRVWDGVVIMTMMTRDLERLLGRCQPTQRPTQGQWKQSVAPECGEERFWGESREEQSVYAKFQRPRFLLHREPFLPPCWLDPCPGVFAFCLPTHTHPCLWLPSLCSIQSYPVFEAWLMGDRISNGKSLDADGHEFWSKLIHLCGLGLCHKMGTVIHTHTPSLPSGSKCQWFDTPTSSMRSLPIPTAHLISPSSESLTLNSISHLVMNPPDL